MLKLEKVGLGCMCLFGGLGGGWSGGRWGGGRICVPPFRKNGINKIK